MNARVAVGISMGDPLGIGPEVILKSLADPAVLEMAYPIILGDFSVFQKMREELRLPLKLKEVKDFSRLEYEGGEEIPVWLPANCNSGTGAVPGESRDFGRLVIRCLEAGVDLAQSGRISALVTGPAPKTVFARKGLNYSGHTEFLALQTGAQETAMMFVGGNLRVVLATIHLPLIRVPGEITRENILGKLRLIQREVPLRFGIRNPRIAVAGLNPHAGEGGLLGKEEVESIIPAIEDARKEGILASGPYPADHLFFRAVSGEFDCLLAMFHDQGLAPFKTLYFHEGVNVTLGLPFIRTAPDHGTARDIAGRGIANPTSMKNAILLAVEMAKRAKE